MNSTDLARKLLDTWAGFGLQKKFLWAFWYLKGTRAHKARRLFSNQPLDIPLQRQKGRKPTDAVENLSRPCGSKKPTLFHNFGPEVGIMCIIVLGALGNDEEDLGTPQTYRCPPQWMQERKLMTTSMLSGVPTFTKSLGSFPKAPGSFMYLHRPKLW